MDKMESFGKILVIVGIIFSIIGGVILIGGKFGLGKLPGDIFWRKGNFTFYFPLATSIILSILLTAILNWIVKK